MVPVINFNKILNDVGKTSVVSETIVRANGKTKYQNGVGLKRTITHHSRGFKIVDDIIIITLLVYT